MSPERQTFHCFGCGKGGNVFQFLMEMDGVTFPEAVRALGRAGRHRSGDRAGEDERSENDALFEANTFAARFYYTDAGPFARGREGASLPRRAAAYRVRPGRTSDSGLLLPAGDALWAAARGEAIPLDVLTRAQARRARATADAATTTTFVTG